jgi:hypothetical protein
MGCIVALKKIDILWYTMHIYIYIYIYILAASAASGVSPQNRVYVCCMSMFVVCQCMLCYNVWIKFRVCHRHTFVVCREIRVKLYVNYIVLALPPRIILTFKNVTQEYVLEHNRYYQSNYILSFWALY